LRGAPATSFVAEFLERQMPAYVAPTLERVQLSVH